MNVNTVGMLAQLNQVSQQVDRNLWSRFISEHGILYDYVGLHGEVSLPTPEECRQCKPNALGWWSPIEDGAFFTGDYLLALLDNYQHKPCQQIREKIHKLIAGLYHLQDVCKTPGMIARGVGSDGRCHYPASSNDQNIPWMLAMWRYQESGIPDQQQRDDCRQRLLRHIQALQSANWHIPGDVPGFERGCLLETTGLEGFLSSVHIAITTKILADISGDSQARLHYQYLDEQLDDGKTRRQIVAEGFTNIPWQNYFAWFTSHAQYAIRELYRRENKPENQMLYKQALNQLGQTAATEILHYKDFDRSAPRQFTADWRVMLSEWQPQASCADAQKVAYRENPIWGQACPAVKQDKQTLLHALPAAWIVMMSEDDMLIEHWLPEMVNALQWFDYDRMHYGALFFAQNVILEINQYFKN